MHAGADAQEHCTHARTLMQTHTCPRIGIQYDVASLCTYVFPLYLYVGMGIGGGGKGAR